MNPELRNTATIFKKDDGTFGIVIHAGKPAYPEDAKIIEILQQKDDETFEEFTERARRFVNEECQ